MKLIQRTNERICKLTMLLPNRRADVHVSDVQAYHVSADPQRRNVSSPAKKASLKHTAQPQHSRALHTKYCRMVFRTATSILPATRIMQMITG